MQSTFAFKKQVPTHAPTHTIPLAARRPGPVTELHLQQDEEAKPSKGTGQAGHWTVGLCLPDSLTHSLLPAQNDSFFNKEDKQRT